MIRILPILFLLLGAKDALYDDLYQPPILDFYKSKYVFEGKVLEKSYSVDSACIEITYEVLKHYKASDNPKTIRLARPSKSKTEPIKWSAEDKYYSWLVCAREVDRSLQHIRCYLTEGDSRYTMERPIFEAGNLFRIEDYAFPNALYTDFNIVKSPVPIDSILKFGKIATYTKPFALLALHIGTDGKLIDVVPVTGNEKLWDSLFHLYRFNPNVDRELTDFEKEAIKLVKDHLPLWGIMRHRVTGVAVNQIQYIILSYDNITNQWKYEH